MYSGGRRVSTSSRRGSREPMERSMQSRPRSLTRGRESVTAPQNYVQRPPLHPSTPRRARASPRSAGRSVSLTLDSPGPNGSEYLRGNEALPSPGWEEDYGGGGSVADRDLGSARQYGRSGERPANAGREPLPIEQQKPLRHGSADGSPAMKLRGYRFRSLEDTRGLEPEGSNTMAHGDHGDEDPMEKAMQLQRRYLHSKILFAGPNPLPALCRIIATAIFLFMVVFVSAAIYTHSTQWMSDLLCMRTIKGDAITSNPVFGAWSERLPTNAIDGKRCRLWVQLDPDSPVPSGTVADFGAYFARTGLECGLFTANVFGGNCAGGRCITCIADRPCYSTVLPEQIDSQDVAWTDNRFPIFPSVGRPANVTLFMDSQTVIQLTDTAVGLEPICSLDGAVKPGHSIVIIGLYIGSIILLLLVIVREIREWFKIRKEVHEDTVDDALMVSHIGEAVEAMKRETESSARHNVDPHDDAAGRHKDGAARRSRVLADRRASSSSQATGPHIPGTSAGSWNIKLENMKVAAAERERIALLRGMVTMVIRILLYFAVHLVAALFIFALSPVQYFPSSWWSLLDALRGIGSASYWPFTDLFVLGDIFILLLLLLLPVTMSERFNSEIPVEENKTRRGEMRQNMLANSEVCVIVLVRSGTCANPSKRQRLGKLVQRCEDLFPASKAGQSKVFVVDFGGGKAPKDDCCNMLRRTVSFNVNYAYLPVDNPVVALHWANKIWIPAVAKRHSFENKDEGTRTLYRFALVVNNFDGVGECALPEMFNSHCREHIERGTQLVILPPRVLMPPGAAKTSWMVEDFLVQRENIRYISFQGISGTVVTNPPKSLCLWDRISLYRAVSGASGPQKVCWPSELNQTLALNQLHQNGCRSELASQPVTVTAHKDLYAKYCADWALQGRLLWELFNFKCTTSKMALGKLWILVDQYIPKFFQIMRPLMLVVIFFRSPFDTVFILVVYLLLLLPLTIAMVSASLRRNREISRQWSMARLLVVLPIVNVIREIFYAYASLYYVIFTYRPLYPSIDYMSRKDCGSGLPPFPEDGGSGVNWFTIWRDREREHVETESDFGDSESQNSKPL